jgi:hypothetical protein
MTFPLFGRSGFDEPVGVDGLIIGEAGRLVKHKRRAHVDVVIGQFMMQINTGTPLMKQKYAA